MQAARGLIVAMIAFTLACLTACGDAPVSVGTHADAGTCEDTSADPKNCGACGIVCHTGTCTNGHCGCASATDCPHDEVCHASGLCVPASDACANVTCPDTEVCRAGTCEPVHCTTAADCGVGETCDPGGSCRLSNDPCATLKCNAGEECRAGACHTVTCFDGARNGDETDVDCGGHCSPCIDGSRCTVGGDCASRRCEGGHCALPRCDDGVKNGTESGVDCGGRNCPACADKGGCTAPTDCASGVCSADHVCLAATCVDGHRNGDETDVDCGGICGKCLEDKGCASGDDCRSGVCGTDQHCAAPACNDLHRNGDETDVDCGGTCPGCASAGTCDVDADCGSGTVCHDGHCAAGCDVNGVFAAPGAPSPLALCEICDPARSTTDYSPDDGVSCGEGVVCHAGACVEGCLVGGGFYASGAADPENACETCHPAISTTAFSPDDGTACGTGMVCTAGTCRTGCEIDFTFRPAGALNPSNPCAACDPAASTTAWTAHDGRSCGDGLVCSGALCREGCFIDGVYATRSAPNPANPCQLCAPAKTTAAWSNADGVSCGSGQVCSSGVCRTGCLIGGTLVTGGTANPVNPCESCQPAKSTTAWTAVTDGATCDASGVCASGKCSASCFIAGVLHAANEVNPQSPCEVCRPALTTEDWSTVDDGTPCGGGNLCHSGACDAGCFIDGKVQAPGARNPANVCQKCDPAKSTSSWSNADGGACGTGGFCGGGLCDTSGCNIGGVHYNDGAFSPDDACKYCNATLSHTSWSDVPPSSQKKYYFTGGIQKFTVPACAKKLVVQAQGGRGGTDIGGPWCGNGASGGLTTATISVTPGEILDVQVGGSGHQPSDGYPKCNNNDGGYNGGQPGQPGNKCAGNLISYDGGGGGGASTVLRGSTILIGAGGGGGGGGYINNSFKAAQNGNPGFGGRGGTAGAGSDTGTALGPNGGDGATVVSSSPDATFVTTAAGPANAVPYVVFFPDGCTIGGVTYAAGAKNPSNACEICDPSRSATSFVTQPFQASVFSFTGAPQTYKVPACATALVVEASGGRGGRACNRPWCGLGGKGGITTATVPVTAGETLSVVVGGDGEVYLEGQNSCGHYNKGGYNLGVDGALGNKPCPEIIQTYDGGGSGGATELLRGTTILVGAAGGGGGGGYVNHSYIEARTPGADGRGGQGGTGGPPGGAGAPRGADAASVTSAITGASNVTTASGASWAGMTITPK